MVKIPIPSAQGTGIPLPPMDGMQDEVRLRFLHEMVLRWGDPSLGSALEIGVYKACSTVVLGEACRRQGFQRITGVDLFTGTPDWAQTEDTYEAARERIKQFDLERFVELIRGDSRTIPWDSPIAVLHVDGDHCLEAVRSDIRRFAPMVSRGGIVIFDDYDSYHREAQHAVHELLMAPAGFEVVGVNNFRDGYGSICLRRR